MILVKAKQMVFYDGVRRRQDSEFYIKNEKEFSEKSMVKIRVEPDRVLSRPVQKEPVKKKPAKKEQRKSDEDVI